MSERRMQIGEVAERTSLSLRTIRYYEEVGLAPPSARTRGGFRLYTESDVERLMLIRRMKPLDFSLDEMRDLLEVLDALVSPTTSDETRRGCLLRLATYRDLADSRVERLRVQLHSAEALAAELQAHDVRSSTRRR